MVKSMLQFIKFVVGSRLGQFLFVVHLVLIVYAFSSKPPTDANFSDLGLGCHGIPIANRAFQYCNEMGLLKVLATLDFFAIVIYALFGMALTVVGLFLSQVFSWEGGPSMNLHTFSWIVALVLLVCTSFQWMFIGSCIEWLIRRFRDHR